MYRIKIFCPFASSADCKEVYERINFASEISFYGKDKKVYITDEDDYTHAIIINTIMPELKIPKENVIGLAFEPVPFLGLTYQFVDYVKQHVHKYYIGDKYDLPPQFVEHFGYMWHSRPPARDVLNKHKTKIMSIVVSNKKTAPGHIYRHQLIEKIIKLNLPIDIYGCGSSEYSYGDRIKGHFNEAEPYENYLYSICIENYQCNHYFSEKIITPLMYNCTPIYLGCKNIDAYFDNIVKLSGNIGHDLLRLVGVINSPMQYYTPGYNEKNIKTVNLIENVEKLYS